MAGIVNIEFLNQNSNRAYPFRENSSLVPSDNTSFRLPNYVIVDFVMSMPADVNTRAYLASMLVVGNFATFMLMDGASNLIASITVQHNTHVAYTGYNIVGATDMYADVRGKLVLGDLSKFTSDVSDGTYTFELATAEFEPCTIRPDLRGVRTLILNNAGTDSEPITGRIKLAAGTNTTLVYDAATNTITFNASSPVDGSYNQPCDCNDYLVPPTIKTINGVHIEDVILEGDGQCVTVTTSGNKITISNICSTPCCGCTELEFIKTNMDLVASNLTKLDAYYASLNERLDQFITNSLL